MNRIGTLAGSLLLAASILATQPAAVAQDEAASFSETVENLERRDGFIPLHIDERDGRILAELSAGDDNSFGRMIYTSRMTSGLGSNPVGIDRGLGGSSEVLRFFRVNDRIFAEFENMDYRAIGAGPEEADATRQSFARSVVWSTDIVAEHADGRVLIDLSGFLTRDPVGTIAQLARSDQGSFSIDSGRSAALTGSAMAFPLNVEIDALITLSSSSPGSEVRAVTPEPGSVTLTVHHSFVALPEPGYQVREADERSGAITTNVYDMASPLDAPVRRSFAIRHRLERVDPSAASGPVVEPIVYYVDRGAPPVIRDALIEGGMWWAEAFENAGFEDAYRVELLPEGVHPLDARYNVIQWVHRQTRGWSYGSSVIDPRTGEIIKGHVLLGSQRVRQDRMIFEGLLGRAGTGSGADDDPLQLALARVRQLSAHEIGHTIGLLHNFAASVNQRASVMDYPAPFILMRDSQTPDVSGAYDVGIGEWDIVSVNWLYSQYTSAEDEAAGLERILADAREDGLLYISDRHARGNNSGHPLANLWDNGGNPSVMLTETMRVRRFSLDRFGPQVMAAGEPVSALRNVFPPIYLFHRYQAEAAAKALGGVDFAYENNGTGVSGVTAWPAEEQRRALDALVATLDPAELDIPDDALRLLAPSPYTDYNAAAQREHFESAQYPAFSRRNAAAASARITLAAMLAPARLARMAEQSARDPAQVSPDEVFDAVETALFDAPRGESARLAPVREAIQAEYVAQLLRLAGSDNAAAASTSRGRLERLEDRLDGRGSGRRDHRLWLAREIASGLSAIDLGETPDIADTDIPPGSPIGADSCWHCDSADRMGLEQ